MSAWNLEMSSAKKLKRTIYQSPLGRKRQRVIAKAEEPGEVKVFSKREIALFNLKRKKEEERLWK